MSNFFLHPATCVQSNGSQYFIMNAMVGKTVVVDNLRSMKVTDEMINGKIFWPVQEQKKAGEEMLAYLEKYYHSTGVKLGYIETTSICPYLCKMCPKSSNRIDRKCHTMSMEVYRSIIDQLPESSELTLHLFGDPFCDKEIKEKILYANKRKILPSFSTNLISLANADFDALQDIRMGDLTVSIDAASAEEMSDIRGKTSKTQFESGLLYLKRLAHLQEELHFADSITLQSIDMNHAEQVRGFLKEMVVQFTQLSYYEKPFIVFPGMEGNVLKSTKEYSDHEWLWIYDLLGERKPYRCLKLWNKKELGILSDGRVVPCCMCYNETKPIGDASVELLSDILNGERYMEFRRSAFYGGDCGEVCNRCVINGEKKYHRDIDAKDIEHLWEYCIDRW